MKVSVFGLGYVGSVSAASLASDGHEVIGVDVSADKVATVNAGKSPVVEHRVEEMMSRASQRGLLRATSDPVAAVAATDLTLVCVGTPSLPNGNTDLSAMLGVATQIGAALAAKSSRHCVVFRSTVPPGTIRRTLIPALEQAVAGERCCQMHGGGHAGCAPQTCPAPAGSEHGDLEGVL